MKKGFARNGGHPVPDPHWNHIWFRLVPSVEWRFPNSRVNFHPFYPLLMIIWFKI
jgi:hypothetical protein